MSQYSVSAIRYRDDNTEGMTDNQKLSQYSVSAIRYRVEIKDPEGNVVFGSRNTLWVQLDIESQISLYLI